MLCVFFFCFCCDYFFLTQFREVYVSVVYKFRLLWSTSDCKCILSCSIHKFWKFKCNLYVFGYINEWNWVRKKIIAAEGKKKYTSKFHSLVKNFIIDVVLICFEREIILIRIKTRIILRILWVAKCEPRNAKKSLKTTLSRLVIIIMIIHFHLNKIDSTLNW